MLLVYLTGGFYISRLLFYATRISPWLLTSMKTSTSSELYTGFFWLLYFCQTFQLQLATSAMLLSGRFYQQALFYLPLLPHFLARFVTQMWAGIPHPESSSVPILTKLSFPADAWSWTTHVVDRRPLVYQLRQWATKYKFTKLLNMCQATYACSKSYRKYYQQDLLSNNKYRLKLLQRNYFLTILIWKNLCFTEKIHSNARLVSSDVFHMFTQSINFFLIPLSYSCLKNVIHQIDSKNEWLLLSITFAAKLELVFVLTFENAF